MENANNTFRFHFYFIIKIVTDTQFDYSHKAGQDFVTVNLLGTDKVSVLTTIFQHLERIGGSCPDGHAGLWTFPSFITSQVIQEIIHNTCFVCGGLMKDSTAFKNYDLYAPYSKDRQKVFKNAGEAHLLNVRKCSQCGHSHT